MTKKNVSATFVLTFCAFLCPVSFINAEPVGTAFTYQGRLLDNGTTADGKYDFQFALYDADTLGTQVGSNVDKEDVQVTDGYFTVEIDFGSSVFTDQVRWLQIAVRPWDSSDDHAILTPRQKITPTPYAIYAEKAAYADNAAGLAVLIASLEARIESLENPPGWHLPELLEMNDLGSAGNPKVAVDGSGNAVAVWHQHDGTRNNIWSNRYDAETGWSAPELIETNDIGNAILAQVAALPSRDVIAVWEQQDGTFYSIWSNRYVTGSGWSVPELIETDNAGNAGGAQIAVDPSGNIVAVWHQHDGTYNNIWSNHYVAGTGWGTAELIEMDDRDAYCPQVAVDDGGNAVAVWMQDDGTRDNIWSNRYVAGTGWGTAELIEMNGGAAEFPQVAVDGGGNAVAVWHQDNGTHFGIWSNRYVVGTGWGTAELIETDNAENAFYPQVAAVPSGNAVAVWHQDDGIRDNIWSSCYVAGTGWDTAELIETDNVGDARSPRVAVDDGGNAVAVWHQDDGIRDNIWSNRYVAGTGWSSPELIEADNAGDACYPQVAVDDGGNAVAVWRQFDGTLYNIWSNRYVHKE